MMDIITGRKTNTSARRGSCSRRKDLFIYLDRRLGLGVDAVLVVDRIQRGSNPLDGVAWSQRDHRAQITRWSITGLRKPHNYHYIL